MTEDQALEALRRYTDEMSRKWAETLSRLGPPPPGHIWEAEIESHNKDGATTVTMSPRLRAINPSSVALHLTPRERLTLWQYLKSDADAFGGGPVRLSVTDKHLADLRSILAKLDAMDQKETDDG